MLTTLELIEEKLKRLTDEEQLKVLGVVEFLARRKDAAPEADELVKQVAQIKGLGHLSDEDIRRIIEEVRYLWR